MDRGTGHDGIGVGVSAPIHERPQWKAVFTLERFDTPIEWYALRAASLHGTLDEVDEISRILSNGGSGDWAKVPGHLQQEADRNFRTQHKPQGISTFENNLLNSGITAIWNLVLAAGTTNSGASPAGANAQFTNTQARLAVGDSSTAFAVGQTWLQAATNKFAQAMDATFPSVSAQTISFKITVTSLNANFAWAEFCTDNGGGSNSTSTTLSGGSSLNRAVSAQGTKASGQTWALTETITLS